MLIGALASYDNTSRSRKLEGLSFLHRFACVYGALLTAFCLFRCFLSIGNAFQDIHKFEHTGSFTYFLYYLDEYQFIETVCTFLLTLGELLLYIAQCRQIIRKESYQWGIWWFMGMFVLHAIIWIHANSLPLPDFGPSTVAEEAGMRYRFFANVTVSPPVIYFILYLLRVHKLKLERH